MTLFGEGAERVREGPSAEAWAVARAVIAGRNPPPRQGVRRLAELVQRFVDGGRSTAEVRSAMLLAPTISQGTIEVELAKRKPPRNAQAGRWTEEQQSGAVRLGEWTDD